MMIYNQRIIYDDNGTETDLSVDLNDFRVGTTTLAIVAAEDKLYIGSILPFNHRHFTVSTANDQASVVSVDVWFANDWVSTVDVVDRTADGGATLAGPGVIQWRTDRLKGWDIELDSENVDGIDVTGLYNLYWARLSFSADLAGTTALSYVGNRFSTDDELFSFYADVSNTNIMAGFETGKTDWNEQHYMAAEQIITDLLSNNIIRSAGQILDYEKFIVPSIHKTAEIIYHGMGRSYNEDRVRAKEYYTDAMKMNFYNVDLDRNANLSELERDIRVGYLQR